MLKILAPVLEPLLRTRTRRLVELMAPHLRGGERVLDVGCGSMRLGREVAKRAGVSWVGVDTVDYNETELELTLYDGKTLPFEDGSFDAAVLSFVLHHCDDPDVMLDEVLRVVRRGLIILEDIPRGPLGMPIAKLHDLIANMLIDPNIPLPYRFKTLEEWEAAFKRRGLTVYRVQNLSTHPLAFVRQTMFVLRT